MTIKEHEKAIRETKIILEKLKERIKNERS